MKIRNGFVSNSSSSSFILAQKKECKDRLLNNVGIRCLVNNFSAGFNSYKDFYEVKKSCDDYHIENMEQVTNLRRSLEKDADFYDSVISRLQEEKKRVIASVEEHEKKGYKVIVCECFGRERTLDIYKILNFITEDKSMIYPNVHFGKRLDISTSISFIGNLSDFVYKSLFVKAIDQNAYDKYLDLFDRNFVIEDDEYSNKEETIKNYFDYIICGCEILKDKDGIQENINDLHKCRDENSLTIDKYSKMIKDGYAVFEVEVEKDSFAHKWILEGIKNEDLVLVEESHF